MGAGVTLLSEEEAPGSGATANDAATFLRTHTQASQVRRAARCSSILSMLAQSHLQHAATCPCAQTNSSLLWQQRVVTCSAVSWRGRQQASQQVAHMTSPMLFCTGACGGAHSGWRR